MIEEWRLGRGAWQRIFDEQWPMFLKGSKYADRKPIGEKAILGSAPVAAIALLAPAAVALPVGVRGEDVLRAVPLWLQHTLFLCQRSILAARKEQ